MAAGSFTGDPLTLIDITLEKMSASGALLHQVVDVKRRFFAFSSCLQWASLRSAYLLDCLSANPGRPCRVFILVVLRCSSSKKVKLNLKILSESSSKNSNLNSDMLRTENMN